jgi:hypothetical protein
MSMLKNAKHEHFAHLVATGKDPSAAYVSAGYSDKGARQSANRLLQDADVMLRVEELKEAIYRPSTERAIEKAALNKTWVIEQLMENVRMAKALEPIIDKEGGVTGEVKQNLPAANRALELLGKELGMFVERHEDVTKSVLDDMPHDELTKLQDLLSESLRSNTEASDRGANSTTH